MWCLSSKIENDNQMQNNIELQHLIGSWESYDLGPRTEFGDMARPLHAKTEG